MKIYSMSKEELEIAQLKNINKIIVYDFLVRKNIHINGYDKKSLLGIMVFAENSKLLI